METCDDSENTRWLKARNLRQKKILSNKLKTAKELVQIERHKLKTRKTEVVIKRSKIHQGFKLTQAHQEHLNIFIGVQVQGQSSMGHKSGQAK